MKTKFLRLGILAATSLLTLHMRAQSPVSSFSLNQAAVCAGSTLQITDMSSDSPDTWIYTVDGQTLTTQNPVVTLNSSGIFSITLVASNNSGPGSLFTETVLVNPLPVLNVTASSPTVCEGDAVNLTSTGASSYTWTGGISNGVNFIASASSVYTVSGEDASGCISEMSYSLTVNSLPVLTVSGNTAVCLGSQVSQTVAGADTYFWSTGSTSNVMTDIPVISTIYTVTGFDSTTGCSNTFTSALIVNSLPTVAVNGAAICFGQSFTITPSGATNYTYSGGNNVVSPVADANYTVSGSDANGCVSTDVVITVTVNALPVVAVNNGTICSGETFTIVPTGALTYSFSSGSDLVSPVSSTSYSVNGTDANGCISTAAVCNVSVNALPVITVNSGVICAGASFTMSASGANTYTYSSGSNIVAPTTTTLYTVTGTDLQGCTSAVAAISNVTVNALPVISVNSGAVCAGASFTLNASGASTYTYSSGSNIVTPVTNTVYSVMGTDAIGCISAAAAISSVTVNALPVVSVNSGAVCAGSSFTLVPSGALTYTYSGGSNIVSPLTTTVYSVMGTDASGCISAIAAISNVTVNALPAVSVNSGAICAGGNFTLSPSGALTYTYSSGSNIVSPTTTTVYTVMGTDAIGCISAIAAISNVTVNALPVISVNSGAICVGDNFTLTPSGAMTYTYSSGTNIVAPATTTVYTVMGTDALGCISAIAAISNVTVNALPVVSISSSTNAICLGGNLTLSGAGATTYTWNTNATTQSISVSPAASTTYTVIGTDLNGCQGMANVSVLVNTLPLVTATSASSVICAGESITLVGSGAISYNWSTGSSNNTIVVSPQVTTSYTVTGTDTNGCSNIAAFTQSVSECTGLTKHSSAMAASVFPNPSTGVLTVVLENAAQASFLSLDGKEVYQQSLESGNTVINLTDFPNGIYTLRLSTNNSVTYLKLVKAGL